MRWVPSLPSKVAYPPLLHVAALAIQGFQYLINQCGLLGEIDSIHNQCEDSGPDLSRRKLSVIFFFLLPKWRTVHGEMTSYTHATSWLHPCIPPSRAPGCADARSPLISNYSTFVRCVPRRDLPRIRTGRCDEMGGSTQTVLLEGEEIAILKLSHAIIVHFLLFYLGFYVA